MLFFLFISFMMFCYIIMFSNWMFLCVKLDSDWIIMSVNLNQMNSIFSMVVIFISLGVYFYSKAYFHDLMSMKYNINLFFFILSMIILINSGDIITMMIGWDGLGISSYFLVSYYSEEVSMFCGMITFFMNRLGDSLIMLFMSMSLNNLSIITINLFNSMELTLFLFGMITKSAQIPFGVWLPMAMSAPTPISSLVHSSTLVTSGLYFIMKLNFILPYSMKMMVMMLGVITFMTSAVFSFLLLDMKKSVALSTLSQLGMMFFSMSMGFYLISFYHLIVHAIFKSSLFVNLGYFMLNSSSIQDSSIMQKKNFLFMKLNFMFSCLSLMGFMFTMGFISKDLILIYYDNYMLNLTVKLMMYVGCIFTGCYSIKLFMFFNQMFMNPTMSEPNSNIFSFVLVFLMTLILTLSPLMFFDMIYTDFLLLVEFNSKISFYSILIFSMILSIIMKSVMNNYTYFSSFFFSYLLNCMYVCMMKMKNMIKGFNFYIMKMEDYIQLFIFEKIFMIMEIKMNYNKLFYLFILLFLMVNIFWSIICLQQINLYSELTSKSMY